ncbi:YraN family protein [Antrihabitans cavernicola]|uniref:UPF0102 protein FOY51_07240 n=1 Tax=Antrihabitans cavernicola TaxID=2495913 RepID=A0A5A7SG37_9NOCA|nr:YraN family protein [Spelaeibacter cavernicola]KAA0023221.1 YraN family protein [Spelaeibacter cavernicola]
MSHNIELGAHGETLAAQFLTDAGMRIECRNWRNRYGEIDLIVRDGNTTAFVEVKTRTGTRFGPPAEAVTFAKQARIRRLAMHWLVEQSGPWVEVRFDVVSVLIEPGTDPLIEHFPAVF